MARKPLVTIDAPAGRVVVRVDAAVYPLDAVYGATYEMIDRAWVFLASAKAGVTIELRRKTPGATTSDLEALAGDLGERLLDHALRVSLARQYGPLRELIVTRALQGAAGPPPSAAPPPPDPRPAEDPYDVAAEWQTSRRR
jgi:His-Xaa-Ser system protein HxsD